MLAIVFLFVRKYLRKIYRANDAFEKDILLIRVPKETPKDVDTNQSTQSLQEDLAIGENIFAVIGGLKANPDGISSWLFGSHNSFSFEIVAHKKLISFYIVVPKSYRRFIEQEIYAHHPNASIEDVPDYNIFTVHSQVKSAQMILKRSYVYPIKTYRELDIDPLDSLINTLGKLNENEGAAIQVLVRSANKSWRSRGKHVINAVREGKSLNEAMKANAYTKIMKFFSKKKKTEAPAPRAQLTPVEEQAIKSIEGKMSKAGLEVIIRVITSAENAGAAQVYLDNITDIFNQYAVFEYGNGFRSKGERSKKLISDFIFRRFTGGIMVLNTEELAGIYHLPMPHNETPNILWLTAKKAPAPTNAPTEGIVLGQNVHRGVVKQIHIKRADRRRHMYVIGKSGTGKSNLIASLARQDIANGEGVCIVDPHGDLIEDILKGIPKERADDVICFSPADTQRPMGLNLLEFDERYPEQKTFVINEMIKIFDKLYDLRSTGGPIFEQYMRNAMLLIMDDPASGSTLMEISKVLADSEFRALKLKKCKDATVVNFWQKEAEKAGGEAALANVVPYITSKLTSFVSNATMRPIIGQQNSSFNLRDIMDQQKILLVNLSKGQIGEMNAHLLGMVLVGKIMVAALSRTDLNQEARKDFYLYIDEFQNFTTDSIGIILSEARKYNLNLIMAHQYLGQLVVKNDTAVKEAVFGNVGTMILFKIGSDDSETMLKEFTPVFNEFDLINIEKYTAYVKLLIDNTASRPFSMSTYPLGPGNDILAQKIKELSRVKYGRARGIVEAEIMQRSKIS
ncbi:MAG: type IV secretion system DNA-binding domain-containing protein [bacterium]|nr:type IV secretion system DNA-binding domain-containing protein [bacterium]